MVGEKSVGGQWTVTLGHVHAKHELEPILGDEDLALVGHSARYEADGD